MHKIVVLGLLIVLSIGVFALSVNSLNGNFAKNVKIQSSTVPSNIIDHLPFIINETDVYYIVEDLTVNSDGITILANNTVLDGRGHTIDGDGTGIGVNVSSQDVIVMNCKIKNFQIGILADETGKAEIDYNLISDNHLGILIYGDNNRIFNNIIINNDYGVQPDMGWSNTIVNNYFKDNIANGNTPHGETNYWNGSKILGLNIIIGQWKGGNYWHDYTGQDSDGDGLGDTSYTIVSNNKDNLPLVDILPPEYSNIIVSSTFPITYVLNITWKDNIRVDRVILQLDGMNYTDAIKVGESLDFSEYNGIRSSPVQHKVIYCRSFTNLTFGTHYYRWFANDTSNYWNSTELLSFNVIGIPQINSIDISPILKVTANITCEGVSNITEVMDYVNLNFKIDDNWFYMPMDYNPTTELYSAMIPVYNQLANETLMVYIVAKGKSGNFESSDVIIYNVPVWVKTDANRDGKIDIKDLVLTIKYFGEHP